ncbi:MAG: BatA domain-containing protein [Planctomycetes bacterium]|nr:BatA domain-containing protein [Planctomycetota bacterium]
MAFFHPLIFATGAAAAAAPIIIHLLNRRRFKIRDWAAMKFLLDAMRKNRRRIQIEEIILMAIRTLAILMLALAIARFTGCAALNKLTFGKGTSQTVVYVLDDSYSMGQKISGSTLFNLALTDMTEQLRKRHQVDQTERVVVLTTSRPDDPLFGPANVTEIESLINKIKALQPSDMRTSLEGSLSAARKAFEDPQAQGARKICIFSDFRRSDLDPKQTENLRLTFKSLEQIGVSTSVVNYGRPCRGTNLTMQSIELMDKSAVAGRPSRIAFTVRNNGASSSAAGPLQLSLRYPAPAGSKDKYAAMSLPSQKIPAIDPAGTHRIEYNVTPPAAGPTVLTASLEEDELSLDNSASLSLDVKDAFKVLVVDGRPDYADPLESESIFFRTVLDPNDTGDKGCKPEVITPEVLPGTRLGEYDLVALLNVAQFPPGSEEATTKVLEEYVAGGGGLMIFAGDRLNIEFYNKYLYADGSGPAPYKLLNPLTCPDKRKPWSIDASSIANDHAVRTFLGPRSALLEGIHIYTFQACDQGSAKSGTVAKAPRVLARFTDSNTSPAIIARPYGKGGVVMVMTTACPRWHDWISDPGMTYVEFVMDCLNMLVRQQREFTELVGRKIQTELADDLKDAVVTLMTPRYPKVDILNLQPVSDKDGKPILRDNKPFVQYDNPLYAGYYAMMFSLPDKTTREMFFSRNPDPVEGELAPGRPEEIQAALGSSRFEYVDRSGSSLRDMFASGEGKEYWIWAICAVLALLGVEVFLGQRFGHYTN